MTEMKDSGVAWINTIPKEWKLKKIKYALKNRNENNNPIRSKNILSLTAKQGVIPLEEKEGGGNKPKEDYSAYKLAYPNDIVMNSMNVLSGSVGLSKYFGCVSPVYYMLRPIDEKDDVRYYNYIFQTTVFQRSLLGLGNGILMKESDNGKLNTIRMRIPLDKLGNLLIPVPDSSIQRKIADYLDSIIPNIEMLLADIEKQIETLEEYKKSIITEAVTKGLINININGTQVDFTNTTDEQWECKKLKLLVAMPIIDGPHESPELCDTGIPYISATAIVDGKIDFNLMRGYISEEYCTECEKRYKPQLNDILVVKLGAGTGQVAMVDDNRKFNIWVPLAAVRCNELVIPKFIYYGFQSDYVVTQMEQSWTYGTQETLGVKTIEKLKFFIPTLNTQRKIIQYLDNKCVNIDGAIEEKKEQLDTLEQYKKSLIYEYVTGKKEVK